MKKLQLIAVGLGFVAAGCGTAATTDGTGAGGGKATTATTGAQGGAGSNVTTGGVGGGDTVTLTMDSFVVPKNSEVYKCQNFANPFGGVGEVRAFESHMTKGSHHLLLFYKDGAQNGALEDCSGLEFAATPYSTQLPDDGVEFPPGVTAVVPSTMGMRLQSHYLNITGDDITAHVEVTFHMGVPGEATQHAGVLFVVEPNIHVAPHTTQTVTHDCHVPMDMNLLKATSHMHQHGTNFLATVSGQTIFQTTQWSDPTPHIFDPAMPLQAGSPLHFECTFENDSDQTLTFGESALTNEMCIFGGNFYPVPANIVTVDCN